MTVREVPHCPTAQEVLAAKGLGLPADEESAETFFKLIGKAFAQKKYDHVLKMLRGLVMARPKDHRIYEAFAVAYQAKGKPAEAVLCFEKALEIDENALHANVNLGEIAWRKHKDAAGARKHLERVVRNAPDHPVAERAQMTLKHLDKAAA